MPKIFNKILCPIGFYINSAGLWEFAIELAGSVATSLQSPCSEGRRWPRQIIVGEHFA
jgi:hypothetical protein